MEACGAFRSKYVRENSVDLGSGRETRVRSSQAGNQLVDGSLGHTVSDHEGGALLGRESTGQSQDAVTMDTNDAKKKDSY